MFSSYYDVLLAECVLRIHCCVRCVLALSVQVLNLSSGNEEIVDPENVWNGVPDWAYRSSEAITPVTGNLQFLPEESLLQEKQSGYSSHLVEDPSSPPTLLK